MDEECIAISWLFFVLNLNRNADNLLCKGTGRAFPVTEQMASFSFSGFCFHGTQQSELCFLNFMHFFSILLSLKLIIREVYSGFINPFAVSMLIIVLCQLCKHHAALC